MFWTLKEEKIRSLIKLVEESDIGVLELSSWGRKIRITGKNAPGPNGYVESGALMAGPVVAQPIAPTKVSSAPAPAVAAPSADATPAGNLIEIKSPMVGTFYSAPSPESPPYISVNEKVAENQVVCIVEAMKLMNEIESEVSGRITKICVENAQPVEFGQVLYLVDPAG